MYSQLSGHLDGVFGHRLKSHWETAMKRFMVLSLILIALSSCKNKPTEPSNTPSGADSLLTAVPLTDAATIDMNNPGSVGAALLNGAAQVDSTSNGLSRDDVNDFAGAEQQALEKLKAQSPTLMKTMRSGNSRSTKIRKALKGSELSPGTGTYTYHPSPDDPYKGTVEGVLQGFGFTSHDSGAYTITIEDGGTLLIHQETYGCVDELPGLCTNNSADIILAPMP
jgi:surface antigen